MIWGSAAVILSIWLTPPTITAFWVRLSTLSHEKIVLLVTITSCVNVLMKAYFICPQVSWIRKRDLHILTVGVHTYSSDARFAALHTDGSDEWTLRVAPAQPRDSGSYECQVSTEPKISLSFRLTVVGKNETSWEQYFKDTTFHIQMLNVIAELNI